MMHDGAVGRLDEIARDARAMAPFFDIGTQPSYFIQLKHEAAGILASFLGSDHYVVKQISGLEIPRLREAALLGAIDGSSTTSEFVGLIHAGINLLGVTFGRPKPKPPICEAGLWAHVEELVQMEAWDKVPSVVATYVEDWVRKRASDPRHKSGARLVGKDLFAHVLSDHSPLVLGTQGSEHEGWRFLGMGLAQAIGNLHRHNIERRPDAEQFAWAVIGLGSLLVGEIDATHPKD